MACGYAGHGLLNIKACWDVPSEVSTLDEALEWWAGQDIPPTFPFVAVLNPLCATFEVFGCTLLCQRSKLSVIRVRGFQQKAGGTYPDRDAPPRRRLRVDARQGRRAKGAANKPKVGPCPVRAKFVHFWAHLCGISFQKNLTHERAGAVWSKSLCNTIESREALARSKRGFSKV